MTTSHNTKYASLFFFFLSFKRGPLVDKREDSRLLVEDGCRSVINEGGAEVHLQGTVTVGRGGVRQGTVTVRLNM